MRRNTSMLMAVALLIVAGSSRTTGAQPLTMQVSPHMAPAPGWVRISARIEPSDDNRELEVAAVSDEFSRVSAIPLDGTQAPRLSVIDYSNLPAGTYEVTAVLVGTHGRRAATSQFVEIMPTPGHR